tara:strand:- start:43 stop:660 length:618 start_codon:yes stop_codon:yes gene_type:complete
MRLLFPTIIHEVKVNNFESIQDDLINFAYREREKDPKGVALSNRGGWQSQSNYNTDDNILLSTIRKTIESYFRNGVFNNKTQIVFDGLWININGKGHWNETHSHPNCNFAGVMWIKAGDITPTHPNGQTSSGDIEFVSPHHFTSSVELMGYEDEFCRNWNSWPAYWIPPEEGKILIFPASIMHKVHANEIDQDRISASFNLDITI